MMKDMMWKAARAANVPYFEYIMQQIKNVSVDAYEALNRIDRKKWTRCAFRPGTNCPQLVNNWAEAFNVFIKKARDQPIITMLNTIYHTIMNRINEERERKKKWKGVVCPRVEEVLRKREENIFDYITRPSGSPRYEVTSAEHSFVVDMDKMECSCGLWQLGGIPCVHAICVYKSHNKDPRKYVHKDFLLSTWFTVYSHFLEPLRGPVFWTKSPYPDILPPDVRVLPGRPKRCRQKDASEIREEAEKAAAEKAKKKQAEGTFRASRKGSVIHCTICGAAGHNSRSCPRKARSEMEGGSQPTPSTSRKKRKTSGSSSQPAPSNMAED